MVALIQPLGGTETRIDSSSPFSGIPTAMSVGLRSGNYVSVWGSVGGSGVRFRLFDPTGNPLGPDQPVRTMNAASQSGAVVTSLPNGGFTVLWGEGQSLQIQSFNDDGSRRGSGGGYGTGNDFPSSYSIIALPSGDLAFAYASGGDINVWVTEPSGISRRNFQINTGGRDGEPVLAPLQGGGFALLWNAERSGRGTGSGDELVGQLFTSLGQTVGDRFTVSPATSGFQGDPAIAALPGGGFAVTWLSNGDGGAAVVARVFDAAARPIGAEIVVDAANFAASRYVSQPTIVAAVNGSFVISWNAGASDSDVVAQPFTMSGTPIGDRVVLNAQRFASEQNSALAVLDDGTLVANWTAFASTSSATSGTLQRLFRLPIIGTDGADNLTARPEGSGLAGLDGSDTLVGGVGNDAIDGGAGADSISGGAGNDSIDGGADADVIRGGAGDDMMVGGAGADTIFGDDGDDLIVVATTSDLAGDKIDGGAGTDIVRLAVGVDLTKLDIVNVEGYDIRSGVAIIGAAQFDALTAASGTFVLSDGGDITLAGLRAAQPDIFTNLVTLRLSDQSTRVDMRDVVVRIGSVTGGAGNDTIVGSATNDSLFGGAGNDRLEGGGVGVDWLDGGLGDDTYVVDADDIITERISGQITGSNTALVTGKEYTLGYLVSVERLMALDPTRTDGITLIGNGLSQRITGTAGADTLRDGREPGRGLPGGDLIGLGGDDTYFIDVTKSRIIETVDGGTDRVVVTASAGSYLLNAGAAIETLSAEEGDAPINIGGNEFSQVINGNDGANILSTGGGGGVDTMNGGLGDDIYRVFSTGDVINDTGGFDTVYASGTSYFLYSTAAVEYLSASEQAGTQSFYLVGNGASQVIAGNYGDNTLNGRGGDGNALPDTLIGLYGNDTYGVFSQGDVVREIVGQGNDVVFASASYQLRSGTEIEVLSAVNQSAGDVGSAYTLRGNEFGQIVAGNNAVNVLDGRDGNDTLVGLGGNDTFAFTTPLDGTNNVDTVRDFSSGSDKIGLASDVFAGVTDGGILAGEFVLGTAAADADDRLIYDRASGRMFYDPDGTGASNATLFAQFAAGTLVTVGDFVVVAPVASLPSA